MPDEREKSREVRRATCSRELVKGRAMRHSRLLLRLRYGAD